MALDFDLLSTQWPAAPEIGKVGIGTDVIRSLRERLGLPLPHQTTLGQTIARNLKTPEESPGFKLGQNLLTDRRQAQLEQLKNLIERSGQGASGPAIRSLETLNRQGDIELGNLALSSAQTAEQNALQFEQVAQSALNADIGRALGLAESATGREFTTSERMGRQGFTTSERVGTQEFTAAESEKQRAVQREAIRALAQRQRTAGEDAIFTELLQSVGAVGVEAISKLLEILFPKKKEGDGGTTVTPPIPPIPGGGGPPLIWTETGRKLPPESPITEEDIFGQLSQFPGAGADSIMEEELNNLLYGLGGSAVGSLLGGGGPEKELATEIFPASSYQGLFQPPAQPDIFQDIWDIPSGIEDITNWGVTPDIGGAAWESAAGIPGDLGFQEAISAAGEGLPSWLQGVGAYQGPSGLIDTGLQALGLPALLPGLGGFLTGAGILTGFPSLLRAMGFGSDEAEKHAGYMREQGQRMLALIQAGDIEGAVAGVGATDPGVKDALRIAASGQLTPQKFLELTGVDLQGLAPGLIKLLPNGNVDPISFGVWAFKVEEHQGYNRRGAPPPAPWNDEGPMGGRWDWENGDWIWNDYGGGGD